MQIKDLKLINFRNYERANLQFNDHLNLIIGKNGMGKTNLVEAIYVLALTKSFRTNNDSILIKKNQENLKVAAQIKDEINCKEYELLLTKEGKKVKINRTDISRLSDYISKINVILFSPNDLKIIKDTPSIRRKMLNIEISQLDNVYLKYLQDYNKLMKQRNAYLKTMFNNSNNILKEYLAVLTNKLIDTGFEIYEKRKEYIKKINDNIADLFFKITNLKGLEIYYETDYEGVTKKGLEELYTKSLDKDILFGQTHLGIHHDDIVFKLNDHNLKEYGSEGQQKNAIIAFKLAEIPIFYKKRKEYPILILDDLFSELDKEKAKNILKLLNGEVQTFITTTELDNINEKYLQDSKIFTIKDEQIEEVTYEK